MAVTFCMGQCAKLYGKCEDCVMKRIGKYKKDDRAGEQMVVITHQPIGSRPRLLSDQEVALAAAATEVDSLMSGQPVSAFHRSKHDRKGQPDYSQYRKSVYRSKAQKAAAAGDPELCSPMLTREEQVQPGQDGSDFVPSKRSSLASSGEGTKAPQIRSTSSSGDESNMSSLSSATAVQAVQASSSNQELAAASGGDFDYCQSLRFAMLYQPGNARLQVTVKSFCILPPNLTAGCYVVASLLTNCKTGEDKVVGSNKTTIKQKTKIPEWEEALVFDAVPRPTGAEETMIRLDVIAFDQFSRETCIGRLKVDINILKDCVSQEFFRTIDEGKTVQPEEALCDASLLVGLFYHHTTHTLVLDMIKVKDVTTLTTLLSAIASFGSGGPTSSGPTLTAPPAPTTLKHVTYFIRARIYEATSLIKERRSQEHKVQEEVLNESLTFNLDRRNIRNVTAEFTLFVRCRKDERQVGWFSLGSTSSGTPEKEHWSNMLRSHASPVVQWMNFKQPPSSPMILSD